MRTIPFFNYPYHYQSRGEEFLEAVRNAMQRGAFIMQKDLFDFEAALAAYLNVKHVIGVADGTMALIMALKGAGISPGDEVLVPSHTFVATAAAVHHAGGIPVLVDCRSDHLICPDSTRRAITPRTRAIMPVQLNGRVADMDILCAIAKDHDLKIVEDSCQAVGARFNGKSAGTFGAAGTASFYPSKTLGCFGDGGAVFTDDDAVADHVRLLRDHGRGVTGKVEAWGYNSRLDNLQAAILNVKLKQYDTDIAHRRRLASIYQEHLGNLAGLLLPPAPDSDERYFDIYQNYEIEADNREGLREHLQKKGIGTIIQWGGYAIHQFNALGLNSDLPYTEAMTKRFMLLPMNTSLADDDIVYICEHIGQFYGR